MRLPAAIVATQPLPPEHLHALIVGQGLEPALAELQAGPGRSSTWQPPPTSNGYGEPWVKGLLQALAESDADLLVLPAPDSPAPLQRALAWTGLEAARRNGRVACTWVTSEGVDAGQALVWGYWSAAGLGATPQPWPLPYLSRNWSDLPRDANLSPRVSVIVRSMDRDTLVEALDSIAQQTYANVDVVIVNARGANHRPLPAHCGGFTVYVAAPLDGQPLQRARAANLGLDTARGELALFLDDDDLLLPDHLAKLVAALQAQPNAIAAFADVELGHDETGRWRALHLFDAGFDPTRLLFENYLPIHAVLFRLPAKLRIDESFDLFEDWDFWLQLAQTAGFVHAPGVSARYRVHGLQQSNVFSDTPVAREARNTLFDKWRSRLSPAGYHAALQQLQQLYRSNAQTHAELALARDGAAAQLAVLRARECEIDAALREQAATQQLVQAREQELGDALSGIRSLRELLSVREADAKASAAHSSSLAKLLAARELEARHARDHIGGLESSLAAREHEIGHASLHAAELTAIVAARAEEITNLRSHVVHLEQQLADQAGLLSGREKELAVLHAETPMLALKRTLRKRSHVTTQR